jgi:hypothetical protein
MEMSKKMFKMYVCREIKEVEVDNIADLGVDLPGLCCLGVGLGMREKNM